MVLSLDIVNDLLLNAVKMTIVSYSVLAVIASSNNSSAASLHRMLLFSLAACISIPILACWLPEIALPVLPLFVAAAAQVELSSFNSLTSHPIVSLLLLGYAIPSLWFFYKLSAELWQLKILSRHARFIPVESLPKECHQPIAGLKRVEILSIPNLQTPMTWGLLRPKLALPSNYGEWDEPRLRHVLLHELAHVRRGDWAATMFAHTILCLLWPLPCIWKLRKQLFWYAEVACDDQVLSSGVTRPEYAASLLSFANSQPSGFAANSLIDSPQVFQRIHTVLDGARVYQSSRLPSLAFACIGLGLLLPMSALKLTPWELRTVDRVHLLPLQALVEPQVTESPPRATAIGDDLLSLKSHIPSNAPAAPTKPTKNWTLDIQPTKTAAENFETPWQPQQIHIDMPLHSTARILPTYPKRALSLGREGYVTVEFDITSRGTVTNEQIISASPAGFFDDAALQALRQFRYSPSYDGGQETIVQRRREIFRFKLNEDAKLTHP